VLVVVVSDLTGVNVARLNIGVGVLKDMSNLEGIGGRDA
jgi:hypothetical protein